MSTCRTCHRPIRWVRLLTSGRALPLDPLPVANGNVALEEVDDGEFAARYVRLDDPYPGPRYRPHFATCPFAAAHRRSGR